MPFLEQQLQRNAYFCLNILDKWIKTGLQLDKGNIYAAHSVNAMLQVNGSWKVLHKLFYVFFFVNKKMFLFFN